MEQIIHTEIQILQGYPKIVYERGIGFLNQLSKNKESNECFVPLMHLLVLMDALTFQKKELVLSEKEEPLLLDWSIYTIDLYNQLVLMLSEIELFEWKGTKKHWKNIKDIYDGIELLDDVTLCELSKRYPNYVFWDFLLAVNNVKQTWRHLPDEIIYDTPYNSKKIIQHLKNGVPSRHGRFTISSNIQPYGKLTTLHTDVGQLISYYSGEHSGVCCARPEGAMEEALVKMVNKI